MSALLEFECRPSRDGYDVLPIDLVNTRAAGAGFDLDYMVNDWGTLLLARCQFDDKNLRGIELLRPRSERARHFDLFQSSQSAFLEFAQTPLTAAAVKALADRYGPLRTKVKKRRCLDDYLGHDINYWYLELRALRKAVDLWDKTKRTGDFDKVIRALERPASVFDFEPEDSTAVAVRLKKDPLTSSARLCIRPTHLRDALWIQFMLTIDGSEALHTCVECKKWFTIKAGRGRCDKEYCSNACRMRAYRKRKGR